MYISLEDLKHSLFGRKRETDLRKKNAYCLHTEPSRVHQSLPGTNHIFVPPTLNTSEVIKYLTRVRTTVMLVAQVRHVFGYLCSSLMTTSTIRNTKENNNNKNKNKTLSKW